MAQYKTTYETLKNKNCYYQDQNFFFADYTNNHGTSEEIGNVKRRLKELMAQIGQLNKKGGKEEMKETVDEKESMESYMNETSSFTVE